MRARKKVSALFAPKGCTYIALYVGRPYCPFLGRSTCKECHISLARAVPMSPQDRETLQRKLRDVMSNWIWLDPRQRPERCLAMRKAFLYSKSDPGPFYESCPALWRCSVANLRSWFQEGRLGPSPHSGEILDLDDWIKLRDRDVGRHNKAVSRTQAILTQCPEPDVPVKELRLATPRAGLGSNPAISFLQQSCLESFQIFGSLSLSDRCNSLFLRQHTLRLFHRVTNFH